MLWKLTVLNPVAAVVESSSTPSTYNRISPVAASRVKTIKWSIPSLMGLELVIEALPTVKLILPVSLIHPQTVSSKSPPLIKSTPAMPGDNVRLELPVWVVLIINEKLDVPPRIEFRSMPASMAFEPSVVGTSYSKVLLLRATPSILSNVATPGRWPRFKPEPDVSCRSINSRSLNPVKGSITEAPTASVSPTLVTVIV